VHLVTKDPTTNTCSTTIIAVDGSDGTKLWSKSFEYCVLLARPISDLHGDKKTDTIISGTSRPEFPEEEIGKIIAVNGLNSAELWSKEVEAEFLDVFLAMGALMWRNRGQRITRYIAALLQTYLVVSALCTDLL